jgi:hypothetical protein
MTSRSGSKEIGRCYINEKPKGEYDKQGNVEIKAKWERREKKEPKKRE